MGIDLSINLLFVSFPSSLAGEGSSLPVFWCLGPLLEFCLLHHFVSFGGVSSWFWQLMLNRKVKGWNHLIESRKQRLCELLTLICGHKASKDVTLFTS